MLTGQSLPATSRAPERCSDPNGYCQVARSVPMNGIVRSTIWSSRQAHSAWMLAATPSSPKRRTSSGCTSWRWAMWCRRSGSVPANASSASRTPRSPMPWTCTWKPSASSSATRVPQRGRRRRRSARCCRSAARPGRGTARSARPCRSPATPSCITFTLVARKRPWLNSARRSTSEATCSSPRVAVPPQRPDDVGGQVSALRGAEVRRTRVVHPGVLTDDRVLPAGDARSRAGRPGPASSPS